MRDLLILGLVGIGVKLLLVPAYFSTDFDVHHNWLRITHTKPLSEWYFDDESKWTLDYPPFFAYFEYLLAVVGAYFNPEIVKLHVTNSVVYFQRLSVILTQIPFLYVLYVIFGRRVSVQLVFSYLFIPLIILDNIHFQYNIMLQTIFLVSLYYLIRKQNYLIAALTYSVLLNFKHIYLYCSIAYFAIILKNYVLKGNKYAQSQNQNRQKIIRFFKVALITLLPFVLSFGPFIIAGGFKGLGQIFIRLFPFGRGLIHDYWAPNFWALYYFADKILAFILKIFFSYQQPLQISHTDKALNYLKILPQPSANITLLIILTCLIPLVMYIIRVKKIDCLKTVMVSGLVFFMLGYHVHQKAITPYLHLFYVFIVSSKNTQKGNNNNQNCSKISFGQDQKVKLSDYQTKHPARFEILKQKQRYDIKEVYCLIFFNIFNLFPLLINIKEKPLKIAVVLLYWLFVRQQFSAIGPNENSVQKTFYSNLMSVCLLLVVICQIAIPYLNWLNGNRFEFLPLMINSVVCAFVNLVWTLKMYVVLVKEQE